jgi:hypothetical protein
MNVRLFVKKENNIVYSEVKSYIIFPSFAHLHYENELLPLAFVTNNRVIS